MEPIDFVIPWVDGSDPEWRQEKARHSGALADSLLSKWVDGEQRYREWGLLKYWFRGVETFAPWVNRVHFITWGHLPPWLNVNHPKLHIVNHRDYIPEKWLPTFSSRCIELNIHRIEGLAEQFVYFNDDTYLTAPTKPTDFFRKGLPCDSAIISPIHLKRNAGGTHSEISDMFIVNERFRKREVLLRDPLKWFSPRYGTALVRTLTQLPYRLFTGFYVSHLPLSYLKTTFDEVWAEIPDVLESTCRHRFRTDADVNQWIMEYWQFCTGRFVPRAPGIGNVFEGAAEADRLVLELRSRRRKLICWNDSPDMSPEISAHVANAFARLLLNSCTFEMEG